jgi:tetratricopeptide (TPR) repeat protein
LRKTTWAAVWALIAIMSILGLAMGRPGLLGQASGKDAEPAIKKGDDLFKNGKYHEAIQAYKDALNKDANSDHAMEYTILCYNKMADREQARAWMKKRLEIPGQTPSIKARVLTDLALLYWDEARSDLLRSSMSGDKMKAGDASVILKLAADGTESAQKAAVIAPKSAKAFNLLNLLERVQADIEQDGSKQKELLAKADEALRHSIEFYESSTQQQQTHDMFGVPTVSVSGDKSSDGVKLGRAKKLGQGAVQGAKEKSIAVEVLVGLDGKVLMHRTVPAAAKPGDAAEAAKDWEFEPSTFEGHTVQVLELISLPSK